jgi:hypothetical protein
MNLTQKLSPRPSNLLGAGLTAGISVVMTMISRRNNPAPASGADTAIRAAKWGLGGYLIGSFVDVQKITRLGDDIDSLPAKAKKSGPTLDGASGLSGLHSRRKKKRRTAPKAGRKTGK